MLLVGSKKSQRLEEIGEDSVSLLPTEPEDMVRSRRRRETLSRRL